MRSWLWRTGAFPIRCAHCWLSVMAMRTLIDRRFRRKDRRSNTGLAEVPVRAAKGGQEFLRILSSTEHFRTAPFGERAAVEFAACQAERIAASERAQATRPRAKGPLSDLIWPAALKIGEAAPVLGTSCSTRAPQ
jgi:hypothetical protein